MDSLGVIGSVAEFAARVTLKILSPRPWVAKEGSFIVMRSTWRTSLLTFGAVSRKVVIDPQTRLIRVNNRIFWAFTNLKIIEFDQVLEIFSTYTDLGDTGYISHYQQDLFCVGLKLKDGSHVTLFRFFGQGDFQNESLWPDWMFVSENLVSKLAPHSFASESSTLVDLLEAYIQAPVTTEL